MGQRRIGLAICDPDGLLATPYSAVIRRKLEEDIAAIMTLGEAEPAKMYLDYCLKEGVWVAEPYKAKTVGQIQKSLDQFITTTKWKQKLREPELEFLRAQGNE